MAGDSNADELLSGIVAFSRGLRESGSLSAQALIALAKRLERIQVNRSVETGAGASTLVFSHRSAHHTAFTLQNSGLRAVQSSPLLKPGTVDFIEGPTQKTLPAAAFDKLQAVLIDGPHAYPFPDLEYFYLYPHIEPGGLLAIDDIHIPTIQSLFRFVRQDRMFSLLEVCDRTAFFERTDAPVFDPWGDGWWLQAANQRTLWRYNWRSTLQSAIPERLRLWLRDRADRARLGK
jgi:hypothetical protein